MRFVYAEDLLDGVQTWYWPDGKKKIECEMAHGIPHGYWREWDESGVLMVDEMYEDGQLVIPSGNAPEQSDVDAKVE